MESHKIIKGIRRKLQIEAGAYDGRFKNKVIKDKRKEESKLKCRIKIKELVYENR